MITGDLDAALGPLARTAGTWRAAPGSPGGYATPAAFGLAREYGGSPAAAASELASRLAGTGWVESAEVTGGGYVTVTVTLAALARLAVRITEAGPGCARSSALAGSTVSAPRDPRLAAARNWEQARRRLSAHLTGWLAGAAGAHVAWHDDDPERQEPPDPGAPPGPGCVASAIAFAGADAVWYTLARLPPGRPARVDPLAAAAHRLGNPAYAVRYAHARAASALRQAAECGLGPGAAAGFRPRLLAHPCELSLLYELSWLPERTAGAARRAQPGVLARQLERVAGAYLRCQQEHPAVWPGMPPGAPCTAERLWLAAAVRTALATGLALLCVTAPDHL